MWEEFLIVGAHQHLGTKLNDKRRLSNVAPLALERERALSLSNDKKIEAFAVAHKTYA